MAKESSGNDNIDNNTEDLKTEYIGCEETEYIDSDNTEYIDNDDTEYVDLLNHRYMIVETLGKGGMGAVYKAIDIRLRNTYVAIKEISLKTIESERLEKVIVNFENEAGTLIKLRHSAIPRVMDFFSLDNDKCYIVMDLIDGETLDEVIRRRGRIPENEVRDWFYQLTDVLKYLHSRDPKIIFRDLKPSNVMLTKDNEIKLIDFGIARTFKDDKDTDTTHYVSKGFSPPEQYGTGQCDERSDIYSLGALLYSLLIGEKLKINNFKFESLSEFIDISDELNDAIMVATDFRPENRPSTVDEFLELATRTDKMYDEFKFKTKQNNKNIKKISIGLIGIVVILLGMYLMSSKEENTSNESDKSSESVKNVESFNSASKNNKDNDKEVEKAIDTLYKVTGADKVSTMFKLNEGDSYVSDPRLKDKYYIFDSGSRTPDGMDALSDCNYLVNKKDYSVYCWPAGQTLIPYEVYTDESTPLAQYFSNFSQASEETLDYLSKNGAEALLNKVKEIIDKADESTAEYYGGYMGYVNMILTGVTKEELDQYVNDRLMLDSEDTSQDSNSYDMEGLYEYGQEYGVSKDDIDRIFNEGWSKGFEYVRSQNDQSQAAIEEYIYVNSPENVSNKIWTDGFWQGYNEGK